MSSFVQYVPFFLSSNLLLQDHAKVFNLSIVLAGIFSTQGRHISYVLQHYIRVVE